MLLKKTSLITIVSLLLFVNSSPGWGCACGCGVFDVGTSAMFPTQTGGLAFLEYGFMNQNKNWSGASLAPAENNEDKQIKTTFLTAGAQYIFNRSWGFMGELPVLDRTLKSIDEDSGDLVQTNLTALGDIRLRAIYTGFSPDLSTGVNFGLKFPTGNHTDPGFDRDTSLGTGSTDLLLGAFHRGAFDGDWNWFTNAQINQPILIMDRYRPGSEVNAAIGGYYRGLKAGTLQVAPVAQVIGTARWRDSGTFADWENSGYTRLLISPGIEIDAVTWRVNVDVGFPVYQFVNGNQLISPVLYKFKISRSF